MLFSANLFLGWCICYILVCGHRCTEQYRILLTLSLEHLMVSDIPCLELGARLVPGSLFHEIFVICV